MRTVRNEVMALSKEKCLEMHEAIQNRTINMSRKFRELLAERVDRNNWDQEPEKVNNVEVLLKGINSFRNDIRKKPVTEPLMAILSDAVYNDITLNPDLSALKNILIIPFSIASEHIEIPADVHDGNFMIARQDFYPELAKHMLNLLANLQKQQQS